MLSIEEIWEKITHTDVITADVFGALNNREDIPISLLNFIVKKFPESPHAISTFPNAKKNQEGRDCTSPDKKLYVEEGKISVASLLVLKSESFGCGMVGKIMIVPAENEEKGGKFLLDKVSPDLQISLDNAFSIVKSFILQQISLSEQESESVKKCLDRWKRTWSIQIGMSFMDSMDGFTGESWTWSLTALLICFLFRKYNHSGIVMTGKWQKNGDAMIVNSIREKIESILNENRGTYSHFHHLWIPFGTEYDGKRVEHETVVKADESGKKDLRLVPIRDIEQFATKLLLEEDQTEKSIKKYIESHLYQLYMPSWKKCLDILQENTSRYKNYKKEEDAADSFLKWDKKKVGIQAILGLEKSKALISNTNLQSEKYALHPDQERFPYYLDLSVIDSQSLDILADTLQKRLDIESFDLASPGSRLYLDCTSCDPKQMKKIKTNLASLKKITQIEIANFNGYHLIQKLSLYIVILICLLAFFGMIFERQKLESFAWAKVAFILEIMNDKTKTEQEVPAYYLIGVRYFLGEQDKNNDGLFDAENFYKKIHPYLPDVDIEKIKEIHDEIDGRLKKEHIEEYRKCIDLPDIISIESGIFLYKQLTIYLKYLNDNCIDKIEGVKSWKKYLDLGIVLIEKNANEDVKKYIAMVDYCTVKDILVRLAKNENIVFNSDKNLWDDFFPSEIDDNILLYISDRKYLWQTDDIIRTKFEKKEIPFITLEQFIPLEQAIKMFVLLKKISKEELKKALDIANKAQNSKMVEVLERLIQKY